MNYKPMMSFNDLYMSMDVTGAFPIFLAMRQEAIDAGLTPPDEDIA